MRTCQLHDLAAVQSARSLVLKTAGCTAPLCHHITCIFVISQFITVMLVLKFYIIMLICGF